MKKIIALVLVFAMVFTMSACAKPANEPQQDAQPDAETPANHESNAKPKEEQTTEATKREFTDSVGRTVTISAHIDKIAVSGPLAQIVVFALCPDKMVGIASKWDKTAEEYLDTRYYQLPVLGQLYGGKGELSLETLLSSGAQVVIDVGEPKKNIVEDLDALQEQTGIPFVHITATLSDTGSAYRLLGELVGMKDEAEKLASYCDDTYKRMKDLSETVDKVNMLYCLGDAGLNVIAQGSFHSEVVDMMSNNLAVVDEPSSKGTGNEVDMEQILKWNPDVILFAPDSIYSTVAEDSAWQKVKAVADGKYYEVPFGPYNWMGFPPSIQRYLGMLWMSEVLYNEQANLDLYQEAAKYYDLFYHCKLTQQQYDALMANSRGK